jgi:hypothetical protein
MQATSDCAPPPLHHSRASAWNGWRDQQYERLRPQIAHGIGKPSRQLQEQGMDLSDELKLAAVKAMQVVHP